MQMPGLSQGMVKAGIEWDIARGHFLSAKYWRAKLLLQLKIVMQPYCSVAKDSCLWQHEDDQTTHPP